jgi:hypothetical protein
MSIVWAAANTFLFLGGCHTGLYVLLFWRICKCVLLYLFFTAHFKIMFMDRTILSAHRINQSIYRNILFPNRCRQTLIQSRSIDTRYSQIDLSPHPVLQSICRHTLFSNRSVDTSYSQIDLSAHPILQSISRHTLFSHRSVDTRYSQIGLSIHPVLQSICRHTMFPNRSLGTP